MATQEISTRETNAAETLKSPFWAFQDDMRQMFNNFFSIPTYGLSESDNLLKGGLQPKLDIAETDKAIEISAELAGAREKDIEVVLEDGVLTIAGRKEARKEEDGKTFHRVERMSGSFRRSLTLPSYVDEDGIKARFENGVLSVTVPKKANGNGSGKKINIAAGK